MHRNPGAELNSVVIPSATYRLQLHGDFTFENAIAIFPYLKQLGISHIYASPFFHAATGSTHGYNVCDHNAINPELGGNESFETYLAKSKEADLGQIVDFVPNHMAVNDGYNPFWHDVLEHGPCSVYAEFFDIDWNPVKRELNNKVLLPVLGDHFGAELETGKLTLLCEESAFLVSYGDQRFPAALHSMVPILNFALQQMGSLCSDEELAELASVISAIQYLPDVEHLTYDDRQSRAKEVGVCKRRLASLYSLCKPFRDGVQQGIARWNTASENPEAMGAMEQVLEDQYYRLSYWKVAGEEINYRRFFDINTLAAIRMETQSVFEATHRLMSSLVERGAIQGIRLDHSDGLANPAEYCERLQNRVASLTSGDNAPGKFYLLVEKILTGNEKLRQDWPIHGTTGYEFTNQVLGLLVNSASEKQLTSLYRSFTGREVSWDEECYQSKLLISTHSMASEINFLGHLLDRIAESHRRFRDFTLNSLTTMVREVVACFPVYRTYVEPNKEPAEDDRRYIERAISTARRRMPPLENSLFVFLRDVVLLPPLDAPHLVNEQLRQTFVLKFQQVTGPLIAKGIEDTASYRFNRLIALNEVGGDPCQFGLTPGQFHQRNLTRLADWPHSMLTTSTHDTKRSEDVRSRIAAISELPEEWAKSVKRWEIANRRFKTDCHGTMAPDRDEEYFLYQTLVGSWPLEDMGEDARSVYIDRIQGYMLKVMREAKRNSAWIQPNAEWEEAVKKFVRQILEPESGARFLTSFEHFAEQIAQLGACNSLTQTLLKCTSPGVPDTYQGSELWDLSLVDPDNRRPVDYERRQEALESLNDPIDPSDLLQNWKDGRIKMLLISRILRFRREHSELFSHGNYHPLAAEGKFHDSVLAFQRDWKHRGICVIVPRFTSLIGFPPIGGVWNDTKVMGIRTGNWKELFTGQSFDINDSFAMSELKLPFAVLVSEII